MAADLAFAFRNHLADKSEATRKGTFTYGVRNWFRFLEAHARSGWQAESIAEVVTSTLNAVIACASAHVVRIRHRATPIGSVDLQRPMVPQPRRLSHPIAAVSDVPGDALRDERCAH
jgi:hypothetical protein